MVEEAAFRLSSVGEDLASRKPAPSKWSAKEILGHLIDSACNNHARFVRVSLEPNLTLPDYVQDEWVRLQAYQERPWNEVLSLWKFYNLHLAHVIECLPEASLEHRFTVGTSTVTLKFLAEDYLAHLEHHLNQVWERVG
ncbi:MAG: DinB family protein [Meiothermus sp.]